MTFIKRHKILTSFFIVLLALVILVTGTTFHFLGKINITDGKAAVNPSVFEGTSQNDSLLNVDELSGKEKEAIFAADSKIKSNLDDSKIWQSSDVMNILLLGVDYGTESLEYGRSDAMIILSVNKAVKKIKLVSISRNVYAAIPGFKNSMISHAHAFGGPALSIKTVEQNYKIKIDNYISCGLESFVRIIDILGGVDIELTKPEAEHLNEKGADFKNSGMNHLNGNESLIYVSMRSIDSDKDRTGRQRKMLMTLMEKFKSITAKQAVEILNEVLPLVSTDFKKSEILYQAASAVKYLNWNVEQHYIPNKSYDFVLRNNFLVTILDWQYEIDYAHNLIFEGAAPECKELDE